MSNGWHQEKTSCAPITRLEVATRMSLDHVAEESSYQPQAT